MAVESWEGLRQRCLLSQMGVCGEGQVAFMPRTRTGSCTVWRTNPWARNGSVSKLTLPLGERPRRPLTELYPSCSWSAWVSVCFCIADVFWPSVAESRIPVGDLRENVTQSDNPKGHQVVQEMTGQWVLATPGGSCTPNQPTIVRFLICFQRKLEMWIYM